MLHSKKFQIKQNLKKKTEKRESLEQKHFIHEMLPSLPRNNKNCFQVG